MQKNTISTPATLDLGAATVLTLCCAIWGVGLVMVKIANGGISPVFNAGLRSVCATAILFLWAQLRGIPLFERDGTLVAGVVCAALFAGEFIALYMGLALTPVSRGTLFLHAAPFVAAYGEHLFVPGHRLTAMRVAGLAAAFAGLALAMGEGLVAATGPTLAGDLLCLIGGIFWGGTTVIIRATRLRLAPAEKTLLYQLAVSALVLIACAWAWGERGVFDASPKVLGAFAYTVIMVVVIGYTTWFWLMRTYSAASLHSFTFLSPIFGVIAGGVILDEPLTPGVLAGLALVAVGIYLVNRPERT